MARCPLAVWSPIRGYENGGSFVPGAPPRGVLHSTEGGYLYAPRSDGTYFGGASPPHFTVATNGVWQHVDTSRSSYALLNRLGGVETNRQGAYQIEVCGKAANAPWWPTETYEALERLMRWLEAQHGIVPDPAVFRPPGWARRFGYDEWLAFDGWCGHQHVPENDHGDPGDIQIAVLFPPPPPKAKVPPMYEPALGPIVASCLGPGGQGALLLGVDAGVYIVDGTPVAVPPGWVIGPHGQPYWGDRQPANITCDAMNHWAVTATSGEVYDYPHAP